MLQQQGGFTERRANSPGLAQVLPASADRIRRAESGGADPFSRRLRRFENPEPPCAHFLLEHFREHPAERDAAWRADYRGRIW